MPDTRIAVDCNFAMDLALPRDIAHDAREVIHRRLRGAQVFITFTAFGELVHKEHNDPSPEIRNRARKAIAGLRSWGIVPTGLTDLQSLAARRIADRLLELRIIPVAERNDALILAEAAVLECQLLISSDTDLRGANPARLMLVLSENQLPMVVIRGPRDIVRDFAGR